jgi:hypothetical protein
MLALALVAAGCPGDHEGTDASAMNDASAQAVDASVEPDAAGMAHVFVYGPVPGLPASDQYAIRVRPVGAADWQDVYAFITTSDPSGQNAYWPILESWSDTYANFETDGLTEIEISRVNGMPITKAAVHPQRKAQSLAITKDGKAHVVIAGPSQIAVDIDGQMDDQDTGLGPSGVYGGPPIHTVTVFANPLLDPRPQEKDSNTYAVQPGETPPSTGSWQTLYFLPGIHDVGLAFPVHAGKTYYIPGDAIVYGTFNQERASDGHDIHFTGYGTLSGQRLTHPMYVTPTPTDFNQYCSIFLAGAINSSVQGPSIVDAAFHSLILQGPFTSGKPTTYQWVKVLGWRKNGDGINPFANGLVEDSFIRTQDDASYANGVGMQRIVYWNDANGSALVLSALPNTPLVVDDIDVIYARAYYNKWSGGRIFNMRGLGGGAAGAGVVFSNIRLEDTRPTLQAFFIAMADDPPYLTGQARTAGALSGVLFQNITLAASSVVGEPDILWGSSIAPIQDLTFQNVSIAGTAITDASHFTSNQYVSGLSFSP